MYMYNHKCPSYRHCKTKKMAKQLPEVYHHSAASMVCFVPWMDTQKHGLSYLRLPSVQVGLDEDLADADIFADFPQRLFHRLPSSQDGHTSNLHHEHRTSVSTSVSFNRTTLPSGAFLNTN